VVVVVADGEAGVDERGRARGEIEAPQAAARGRVAAAGANNAEPSGNQLGASKGTAEA
jgi:hypothetical protein